MTKRIGWTDQARADVRAVGKTDALQILHTIARYAATDEGDVKRLKNVEPSELRLRAGDYRVRFYDHGQSFEILAVKHRREAYRS